MTLTDLALYVCAYLALAIPGAIWTGQRLRKANPPPLAHSYYWCSRRGRFIRVGKEL